MLALVFHSSNNNSLQSITLELYPVANDAKHLLAQLKSFMVEILLHDQRE